MYVIVVGSLISNYQLTHGLILRVAYTGQYVVCMYNNNSNNNNNNNNNNKI